MWQLSVAQVLARHLSAATGAMPAAERSAIQSLTSSSKHLRVRYRTRIQTLASTLIILDKSTTCPGDASCPFLKNECSVTEHIHTESCYDKISYEVHGPNNTHTHTQDCKRHTIGTHGTWTSNSHYSSHSVTGYKTTLDGYEVVAGDDGFTYMFGSECQRGSTIQQ